jgi:hypothetical protein
MAIKHNKLHFNGYGSGFFLSLFFPLIIFKHMWPWSREVPFVMVIVTFLYFLIFSPFHLFEHTNNAESLWKVMV